MSRPPDLVASHPSPFDVAALFVHQRQRSARSHSAIRRWLNPPARPGRGRIVCARRWETWARSRAPASTAAGGHRCDVSPVSKLPNLTSQPPQSPSRINNGADVAGISAKAKAAYDVPLKMNLFALPQKQKIIYDSLFTSAF